MSNDTSSSGGWLIFLVGVALAGGVTWELYNYGIIGGRNNTVLITQPVDNKTSAETTPEENTPTQPVASSTEYQPEPAPVETPKTNQIDEAKAQAAALAEKYRKQFQLPKPGSVVTLKLKTGSAVQGQFKSVTGDKVTILMNSAEVLFTRSQLTGESCMQFFADDFVASMTALAGQKPVEYVPPASEPVQQQPIQTTSKPTAPAPKPVTVTAPVKPVKKTTTTSTAKKTTSSKKTDSHYADQTTETDLLKARRERVQQHEESSANEGKDF